MALLSNNEVKVIHISQILNYWRDIQQLHYTDKYPDIQITSTFERDLDAVLKYANRIWTEVELNEYIQRTEYPDPIPLGEREWFIYSFYNHIEQTVKVIVPQYTYREDFILGYEDNVFYIVDYRRKTYVPATIEIAYRQRRGEPTHDPFS